jgi:HrpA-like RNA helicase
MDTLAAVAVSKAEAKQRTGRAGREAPGITNYFTTELFGYLKFKKKEAML